MKGPAPEPAGIEEGRVGSLGFILHFITTQHCQGTAVPPAGIVMVEDQWRVLLVSSHLYCAVSGNHMGNGNAPLPAREGYHVGAGFSSLPSSNNEPLHPQEVMLGPWTFVPTWW